MNNRKQLMATLDNALGINKRSRNGRLTPSAKQARKRVRDLVKAKREAAVTRLLESSAAMAEVL